jgi:hypothetical protein
MLLCEEVGNLHLKTVESVRLQILVLFWYDGTVSGQCLGSDLFLVSSHYSLWQQEGCELCRIIM